MNKIKILFAHNFYGSATPSGENQVVESEQTMLRAHGHSVSLFSRHSDQIRAEGALGAVKGALSTPWNPLAARALKHVCTTFGPDVVHVHNTFPLISPSIFSAIGRRAARVLTLHNYRLFCPAAIPMRSGRVCTDCLDRRSALPAVVHGCYRQSRLASVPLAMGVALHRALGTWSRQVDAFICLSAFQRELMVKAGLPREKVHLKPNFYPSMPAVLPWAQRAPYVVFAGRLTPEKGVENLLRAWQQWGGAAPELRIVGDGPLRAVLEQRAQGLPVRFLGQLDAQAAQHQIANSRLLLLPSEWFEGFPLVIREAFAFGTPCAVSDLGPLPSIVEHGRSGVVFTPAQPAALLAQVRTAWETTGLLAQLGQGARQAFEQHYTEAANYTTLMNIYQQAIEVSRHG